MRKDLIDAIGQHKGTFGLTIDPKTTEKLADYYDLVQEHNEFLHLVGPASAEEFAIRHILESLTLLEHLPRAVRFADVGAGAGLPSIPCLLARDDLRALLIESKEKKSKFLELAVERLGIAQRTEIVNKQFQEVDPSLCRFVTCRALDKFTERLPRLLKWSKKRGLLLFGGNNLVDVLKTENAVFRQRLIPMSEQRFLFVIAEG